jgi:hypothetical protein
VVDFSSYAWCKLNLPQTQKRLPQFLRAGHPKNQTDPGSNLDMIPQLMG